MDRSNGSVNSSGGVTAQKCPKRRLNRSVNVNSTVNASRLDRIKVEIMEPVTDAHESIPVSTTPTNNNHQHQQQPEPVFSPMNLSKSVNRELPPPPPPLRYWKRNAPRIKEEPMDEDSTSTIQRTIPKKRKIKVEPQEESTSTFISIPPIDRNQIDFPPLNEPLNLASTSTSRFKSSSSSSVNPSVPIATSSSSTRNNPNIKHNNSNNVPYNYEEGCECEDCQEFEFNQNVQVNAISTDDDGDEPVDDNPLNQPNRTVSSQNHNSSSDELQIHDDDVSGFLRVELDVDEDDDDDDHNHEEEENDLQHHNDDDDLSQNESEQEDGQNPSLSVEPLHEHRKSNRITPKPSSSCCTDDDHNNLNHQNHNHQIVLNNNKSRTKSNTTKSVTKKQNNKKKNNAIPNIENNINVVDDKRMSLISLNCTESKCKLTFDSIDSLNRHLERKHKLAPYQCFAKKCKLRFGDRTLLREHIGVRHSTSPTTYKCPKCASTFTCQDRTYRHYYKSHLTGLFQCQICSITKETRARIYAHLYNNHPSSAAASVRQHKFDCTECSASFEGKAILNQHKLLVHPTAAALKESKEYHCKFTGCKYKAPRKETLIRHIRMQHFHLPATLKRQKQLKMVDSRDPKQFVQLVVVMNPE